MNRRILFYIISTILIFLISFNEIDASDTDTIIFTKGISVSYWGTLINNNGLLLSLEKYYLQTEKFKIIGSASIVFQRRKNVYTSAGLIVGSALRKTYNWGVFFEYGIKFGYLGSYYDFDFYKTNSDGNIVNIGRKWTNSIILGYSLGLGYNFSKLTKTNLQLFIKPNLYYRFPNYDNIFYFNNYSIEVGLILHPKWFK
jgi:hypothetical protein